MQLTQIQGSCPGPPYPTHKGGAQGLADLLHSWLDRKCSWRVLRHGWPLFGLGGELGALRSHPVAS